MTSADDPGSQRPGAMIHQLIDEAVLFAEDDRDQGFGVKVVNMGSRGLAIVIRYSFFPFLVKSSFNFS